MDSVVIDYGLDPSGYLNGLSQIAAGNTSLQQSMAGVVTGSTAMQRAMGMITPARLGTVAISGVALAAAHSQQTLQGMEAASTITQVSVDKLSKGIRSMARDMPIGTDGATALVTQFTKMGVASQGSESKILKLSTTVAKLGGATGENATELATGLTSLARITGNTNLDPKRYEALADSLTTVANKSGASATGILQLSKNIAPMAQAAGIGATGVLGISSAFARLGEDGVGASTSVNKMLGDMNRAMREGGPEIMAYANIVGKTSEEFTALFKANPTEAITQVTEAIANAGSAGPRQLESIGIEGIRGQRQFQGVMATGGLRPGVKDAVEGYGSGATGKAADAAFGGLNDSLGELRDATGHLASSMGEPLLSPLTAFAKGLLGATSFLAKVAEHKLAQGVLATVGGVVGIGMLAKSLVGGAATIGMGRQAATSGLVRAIAAGLTGSRGDTTSRLAKFGERAQFLANSQTDRWGKGGQLGHVINPVSGESVLHKDKFGNMVPTMRAAGNFERSSYLRATGVGATLGPVGTNDRNLLQRMGAGLKAYGGNMAVSYADSARANLWNQSGKAGSDPFARKESWLPSKGFKDSWAEAKRAGGLGDESGRKAFHAAMMGSTTGVAGLGKQSITTGAILGSLAKAAGQAAVMTGSLAKAGAGAMLTGGKAVAGAGLGAVRAGLGTAAGAVGGAVGIGLMGAMGLAALVSKTNAEKEEKAKSFATSDINETLNAYREQAGQATKAVVTVTATGAEYAKSVAGMTKTMAEARVVSDEAYSAGKATESKIVRHYSGTAAEQAAQISGNSITGLTPDDVANAAIDLSRDPKNNKAMVQAVIDALPQQAEFSESQRWGLPTGGGAESLRAQIAPVIRSDENALGYKDNWRSLVGGSPMTSGMSDLNQRSQAPGWYNKLQFGIGGGLHQSRLQEDDDKTLKSAVQSSSDRRNLQSQTFSPEYAKQEQLSALEAMMGDAEQSGDAESYLQLGKYVSAAITGGKEQTLSPALLAKHGGLSGALAAGDPDYAKRKKTDDEESAKQPGGVWSADQKQSIDSLNLAKANSEGNALAPTLSKFFDARGAAAGSPAAASNASAMLPANLTLLDTAVKAMTGTTDGSAAALAELQSQARGAMTGLQPGTPRYEQAAGVEARSGLLLGLAQSQQKPSEVLSAQITKLSGLALNRENTTAGKDARKEGEEGLAALQPQVAAQMTARIQAQFAANTSMGYAKTDHGLSTDYAKADYSLQVGRTNRDFNTSQRRAEEDHQLQLTRSQEDFDTSRLRALRDFNISVAQSNQEARISQARASRDFAISEAQSHEDAATARFRAIRDFNIALKREIEDSMSSMYDPYTRIQTKPTWDGPNLLVNLKEQNEALDKQKRQLDEIRKAGVSQASIDFLGLGKTENAQQLTNLAADIKAQASLAGELNAATSKRSAATGALATDASNVSQRRSREELNKGFADTEADLAKSLARGRKQMSKGFADQNADLGRNLAIGLKQLNKSFADQDVDFAKNLKRTNFTYSQGLARNAESLATALGDMELSQNTSLSRQELAFTNSMARTKQALLDADKGVGQDFAKLSETYNRVIHGNTVNWTAVMVADGNDFISVVTTKLIPTIRKIFADSGIPLPGSTEGIRYPLIALPKSLSDVKPKPVDPSGLDAGIYADGGTIGGYSPHPRADNIHIRATAGEFMQPVSAVDHYGVAAMEAIRTRSVPREALSGYWDGGLIAFGKALQKKGFTVGEHPAFGGVYPVHAANSWHYRGGAIDVNKDNGHEKAEIDAILAEARKYSLRSIWQVKGHFDHAHFDIAPGPDMVGKGYAGGGSGGGSGGGAGGTLDTDALKAALASAPKGGKLYNHLMGIFTANMGKRWYDDGGDLPVGTSLVHNGTGKTEKVLTGEQWAAVSTLVSAEQGRSLGAAKGAHMVVHHNETITHDNRNDFSGAAITVVSADPDDMARRLEAKATAGRLGQTRGVKR